MRIYKAERIKSRPVIDAVPESTVRVTVNGMQLDPRPSQKIWNHSPTGFEWGYGGFGPAQLALAILFDVTKDKILSVRYHQRFKFDWIAGCDPSGFEMTEYDVKDWLQQQEKEAS